MKRETYKQSNKPARKTRVFFALVFISVFAISALGDECVHVPSLLAQSRGIELAFRYQDRLFEDNLSVGYLNDLLAKIATPIEIREHNLRVLILRTRTMNAFALPDGTIYITTGLLARLVNETQIAAVLAHEVGHIIKNHSARTLLARKELAEALLNNGRRQRQNRRAAQLAPPRQEYVRILSGGIGIADDVFYETVHNYAYEFEREADSIGVARLTAARFLIDGKVADTLDNTHLIVRLWNVILYETDFAIAGGDFELAHAFLDRLMSVGTCDATIFALRGDMERLLAPRSTAALNWYERALSCDPQNDGVLLAAGLAHKSIGRNEKACEFFKKYSELPGDSPASQFVNEALQTCEER